MARKNSWYEIQNATDSEMATAYIYDEISAWGVTAQQFCADLAQVTAPNLTVKMNSPGGNVFDGVTIHNALKSSPCCVTVQVDGLAASIASVIAMAGDKVCMAPNAMMMIHNAWAGCCGNAAEMTKMAETLNKIDGTLLDTYANKASVGKRAIKQMMADETWMTAKDALDAGFCDCIGNDQGAKASFDLTKFKNTPASAMALYAQPKVVAEIEPEPEPKDAEPIADPFLAALRNATDTTKIITAFKH